MVDPLSRRALLRMGIGGTALGASGCLSFGPDTEYQPVTIRNQRGTTHDVALVFDRGEGYSTERRTARLSPDETAQFDEFIPSSDWDYPYRLETHVDGEHLQTTPHRWESTEITVTLVPEEAVQITNVEPNDVVSTPTDQPTSPSETSPSPAADS